MNKHLCKSFVSLLLSIALLFACPGCFSSLVEEEVTSTSSQSSYEEPASEAGTSETKGVLSFRYTYTEEEEAALREQLRELNDMLDAGIDYEAFEKLENEAEDAYTHLSTQASISNLYHYLDLTDDAANEHYLFSSSLESEMGREFVLLYKRVYDSPFRDAFFADWPQDAIEEMLTLSQTYTEEVLELLDTYDRIRVDYGNLDENDPDYADAVAALYSEQISVLNLLGVKMGYANFYEYAYPDEYGRDYTPEEADEFRKLVKLYIPDLVGSLAADLGDKVAALSNREINKANGFLFDDMDKDELLTTAKGFYAMIGGDNEQIFLDMLADERYLLYDAPKAMEGAFTMYLEEYETPIVYYGPGYHNLFTFLHESGHYCAFVKSHEDEKLAEYRSPSNDLCEVHSQGTEWLYLSFAQRAYSEEFYAFLVEYRLYCDLVDVVICTVVDAFEERCYRETPSPDKYDDIMMEICDDYGGYAFLSSLMSKSPLEYWRLVTIENPVYYISYPVSLLPSIELYLHACENRDTAVAEYLSLFGSDCIDFLPTLNKAGLQSPFEKSLFRDLERYVEDELIA